MPIRSISSLKLAIPAALAALALAGCADDGTITEGSGSKTSLATGNWQLAASGGAAAGMSGVLTQTSSGVTGILHAQPASACGSFTVTGNTDQKGNLTLSGSAGQGLFSFAGAVAADGRSIQAASYGISGGACATARLVPVAAQVYTPVSGSYSGAFTDADGQVAQITATLNQSANADGSGNYTLTGSATLPNNPCFPATVPVSATQVTGGTFTFTYANSSNSVTATGTFSPDAGTLTVSNWVSSGTCGADQGRGTLTRQ